MVASLPFSGSHESLWQAVSLCPVFTLDGRAAAGWLHQECRPQAPPKLPHSLIPSLYFPLLFTFLLPFFSSFPLCSSFTFNYSSLSPITAPPQVSFLSFCHLSHSFSNILLLLFSPPLPFLTPLFKIQLALSKLTHTLPFPCHHSLASHISPSLCPSSLIPMLSNPNKPGRTFLCGGCRRNTPHVRLGLNINISRFVGLQKDMRCLSSTWATRMNTKTRHCGKISKCILC